MPQSFKLRLTVSQLFITILFISLFVMSTRAVLDADFWWHLRTGQWIAENHAIPHVDPFSSTLNGNPWTAHEWLSELILYTIYRAGGLTLLTLTFAGIITIAYALAYWRSSGRPYIAGFATILGAIASAPIWGVRPQIFTLLLFSLSLYLLDKYFVTGNIKVIILLPLLMVLWVNLHAGYMLGLALLGLYVFLKLLECYLPDALTADNSSRPNRKLILPAAGVFGASCLAVIINPNGVYMYVYPFETLSSKAMMALIEEWLSPNFHLLEWLPLALFMTALVASGLFSRKRSSVTEIVLTAILGYAALRSMRNVPLFAVAAIPVLAFHLDGIFHLKVKKDIPSQLNTVVNASILGLVLLVALVQVSTVMLNQNNNEKDHFPVSAVEWIKNNNPRGNIFNTYGWGGYLIWHLYPNYKVYVDGRADVYGDAYLQDFISIYGAQPGWEDKLQRADVNLALVETGSPIANALSQSTNWRIVIKDDLESLYVRQ
jgi:hypothetical protein